MSFYAEFVHTYMGDIMTASGTEIVNSIRDAIRSGELDIGDVAKKMAKSNDYPEIQVNPLAILTFITKEYLEFLGSRNIGFNAEFQEFSEIEPVF